MGYYEIWLEANLETHCHDHLVNTPQDRLTFTCKNVSLTHECMGTSMCIAKGIIVNVREYDMVEGEMLGEKELCVKSKSVAGTNLGLSLTGMLTHGHSIGGFGHFSLPSVHMGSHFTITSLAKCLRDLEDPHLDMYGDLLYESGSSRNTLSNALFQNSIYSKCRL